MEVGLPQPLQLGRAEILFAEAGHGVPECAGLGVKRRIVDGDQHEHDLGAAAQDLSRGGDTPYSRHYHIYEDDLWSQASGSMDRLLAGARHAGHGEAGRGIDQIPERLAEGAMVIDDQDRHVARRLAGGGERLAAALWDLGARPRAGSPRQPNFPLT